MAFVCQTCGNLGWTDFLVYCSLCGKAVQHRYCMDIIPKPDEVVKWSCDDCTTRSIKLAPFMICQGNEDTTCKYTRKLVLADDDDDSIDDFQKESLLEMEMNVLEKTIILHDSFDKAQPYDQRKSVLSDKDEDEWSKPSTRRRKLVLPNEDDLLDGIEKKSSLEMEMNVIEKAICLYESFVKAKPNDQRRRLVLLDEDNEHIELEASSLKETIVSSKNSDMKDVESGSTSQKTVDVVTTMTKGSDHSMKRSSEKSTRADEQLPNLAFSQNGQDSVVSPSELYYILSRPIRSSSWRGWFKICGRAYGPLTAHMSTKAGEKAWNATRSLPQVIQLTMVSRSRAWPRSFKISPPTDDHIALFFFPPDSRVEKMVDELLEEVIRCDLALKVLLDEAEMLIFPSVHLPEDHKRYQGKYYLWGVFKCKDSDTKSGNIIGVQQTNENSTTQTVHKSSAGSEQVQRERVTEHEVVQDKLDNGEEILSEGDEGGNEEELNGCLELFPMQVENITLKLKVGDGKKDLDLELGLNLPI